MKQRRPAAPKGRSLSSGRAVDSCPQFLEKRYFLAMLRFHARCFENKGSVDYCWVLQQLCKRIHADKTITDANELKKQLKRIKDQGYAHSEEELAIGARTLAAPIFGAGNKVVAALGIVTPVDNQDIMRVAPLLVASANALSKKLIAAGISDLSKLV